MPCWCPTWATSTSCWPGCAGRGRPIVLDYLVSAAGTARDRGERGGAKLDCCGARQTRAPGPPTSSWSTPTRALPAARRGPEPRRRRAGRRHAEWFDGRDRPSRLPASGRRSAWSSSAPSPPPGHDDDRPGARPARRGYSSLSRCWARARTTPRYDASWPDRGDVTWHDWVPIDELPAAGRGPRRLPRIFGDTEKALTVVPTKIYQGAAAGCALVTSDTAPQRRRSATRPCWFRRPTTWPWPTRSPALAGRPARWPGCARPRLRGGRRVPPPRSPAGRAAAGAPGVDTRSVRRSRRCRHEPLARGGRRPAAPGDPRPAPLRRRGPHRRRPGSRDDARGRLRAGSRRVLGSRARPSTSVSSRTPSPSRSPGARIEPRGGTVVNGTVDDLEPGRRSTSCAPSRCSSTSRTTSPR